MHRWNLSICSCGDWNSLTDLTWLPVWTCSSALFLSFATLDPSQTFWVHVPSLMVRQIMLDVNLCSPGGLKYQTLLSQHTILMRRWWAELPCNPGHCHWYRKGHASSPRPSCYPFRPQGNNMNTWKVAGTEIIEWGCHPLAFSSMFSQAMWCWRVIIAMHEVASPSWWTLVSLSIL